MAALVPLPSFNPSYPIFSHFPHDAIFYPLFAIFFFRTSDQSLDTDDIVWKGLKQLMQKETRNLSHATIPKRFLVSFSSLTQ